MRGSVLVLVAINGVGGGLSIPLHDRVHDDDVHNVGVPNVCVHASLGGGLHGLLGGLACLVMGACVTCHVQMLSGVGPKDHLAHKGIPVVKDLPVGQNLVRGSPWRGGFTGQQSLC
jgi:hypothetical protein